MKSQSALLITVYQIEIHHNVTNSFKLVNQIEQMLIKNKYLFFDW